ncbi:inositol monophosphatase family protein [Streptomyces sp. TRM76323]|uniref:inositol-phosphate phosphatase n=1 Tax=Streptomyces tamarix TaxID=3078565 RepID=A0ABU3QIY4_9ACTN|nr:inositol monophosphatase family protein [Streptomyces tamarix]MDT9682733.1 inositol monophosphatase family protein [Streptomyces tamarix]
MIDDLLDDTGFLSAVEDAVRGAAADEVMPRWRRLAAHEVDEKSGPHDLVTVADRAAEERLTKSLSGLLPGSAVVGEEGVHADPGAYDAVRGDAPVWIVDPVDGTRQFVRGEPGFCTLVALARHGRLLASWTHAPALGETAVAVRGGGARLNGEELRAGTPGPGAVLRVATAHPDHTTPAQKRALRGLAVEGVDPRPCGSAGLAYLAVARGDCDAVAFTWEYAWDHAAGLLLVTEAGGAHRTIDGVPFRVTGGNALPFTAARDAATAARVASLLRPQ